MMKYLDLPESQNVCIIFVSTEIKEGEDYGE